MRALLSAEYSDDSDSGDGEDTTAKTRALPAFAYSAAAQPSTQLKKRNISSSAISSSATELSTVNKKSRSLPPPSLHLQSDATPTAASVASSSLSDAAVPLSAGRVRVFPHVEGNWPTHVYIALPESSALTTLMDECASLLPARLAFQRLPPSDLHISLSRCVTLRHHHIQHFTHLLSSALSNPQLPCTPLPILLQSLALYCNEQRTRSFAALRLGAGEDELLCVLAAVDGVMREMGLQTFYERPELHVSYAWRLGDVWKEREESSGSQLQQNSIEWKEAEVEVADGDETTGEGTSARDTSLDRPTVASCLIEVSAVHCKVGNRLTIIPLKAKR